MKPIYKILSVLSILILTGSVYAAVQSSYTYTGCLAANTPLQISSLDKGTFYNIQPGSQPISTCKPGDYMVSLYDKVQLDSLINTITNQINSLTGRATNLENNQRYIQGSFQIVSNQAIDNYMKTINTIVFDVPGDSNVYVEVSGWVFGSSNPFYMAMDVDQEPCGPSWCWTKDMRFINPQSTTNLQRSEVYRLSKGSHTIYLDAGWGPAQNIFATINYNIVASAVDPKTTISISSANTNGITTMKDGKILTS